MTPTELLRPAATTPGAVFGSKKDERRGRAEAAHRIEELGQEPELAAHRV